MGYHKPWMVHESTGPVDGFESQNCVWSNCPPGALKQQVSWTAVEFWQLVWGFEQVGGEPPETVLPEDRSATWEKVRAALEAPFNVE